MWTPTSDLLRDLHLKRAALLPPADRPKLDAAALLADLDADLDRILFVRDDGTDARLDPARLGALVMHRAQEVAPVIPLPTTGALQLIRRSGQVVAWNPAKIEVAVRKAFLSRGLDSAPAEEVALRVTERAAALGLSYVPIETVQDLVQEELLLAGHTRVAEAYITYRAERAVYRATQADPPEEQTTLVDVVEADGTGTLWDGEELRERIRIASVGLDLCLTEGEIEKHLRRRNISDGGRVYFI